MRTSLSQDSTSSTSGSGSAERPTKRKHISFNTFVEQCIAIDKHSRQGSGRRAGFGFGDYADNELAYEDEDGEDDDDGYEEDREDNFFDEDDPLWLATHGGARPRRRHLNGSAIHSDSDSDDGAIEIRPSTYRHTNLGTPHAKKKATPRSKSASSSSSATTSTTTSSTSSSTGSRQRRKSASALMNGVYTPNLLSAAPETSAYRPRSMHPSQPDTPYRDRVTIAPIAPTLLKTTGAWEEGFGDEGGASDDGLWDYGVPTHGVNTRSDGNDDRSIKGASKFDEEPSSDGTPVELVYVPPFGSIYGYGAQTYWRNRRGETEDVEDEEEDETTADDAEEVKSQLTVLNQEEETPKQDSPLSEAEQYSPPPIPSIPTEFAPPVSRSPVPVVIIDSSADSDSTPSESDKLESRSNSSSSTSTTTTPVPVPASKFQQQEEEPGRGRGRSLSISPVGGSSSNNKSAAPPSSSSNSGLLSSRGRSQSCQDLQSFYGASVGTTAIQGGSERRGRSNMRGSTSSNSGTIRGINSSRSSHSSQSHSGGRGGGSVSPIINSSTSPIGGSLSPDGNDAKLSGGIGSACASGRMGGRERESRLLERNSSSSSVSSKATSVSGSGGDDKRGRDRGRRDIGSGSGSSTSPIAHTTGSLEETRGERGRGGRSARGGGGGRVSLSPQDVFDIESAPPPISSSPVTIGTTGIVNRKAKAKEGEELSTMPKETGITLNGAPAVGVCAPKMEMNASICSVSSEGSTATIVPTSNVVSPTHKAVAAKAHARGTPVVDVPSSTSERDRDREIQFEKEALDEAERWRKNVPTPSNSPVISMTAPRVVSSATTATATPTTPTSPPAHAATSEYSPIHVRTISSSSAHSSQSTPTSSSKYKAKPPSPIVPSPPHPALPSTSSSHAPGEVGPSGIFSSYGYGRSASTSLERASSGSRERSSPSSASSGSAAHANSSSGLRKEITPEREQERELAEARRGRNSSVATTKSLMSGGESWNEPTSSVLEVDGGYVSREREKGTIIDKAVGMVSSAGAYLKLWPGQGNQSNAGVGVGAGAGGPQ